MLTIALTFNSPIKNLGLRKLGLSNIRLLYVSDDKK